MKINKRVYLIVIFAFLTSVIFSTSYAQVISGGMKDQSSSDRIVRVATTTWNGNGTKQQNLDNIDSYLADAAKNNPDIVVLSEGIYSIDGNGPFFEPVPGPFTNAMCDEAKKYNTYIVANLYEDGQDGHRYNTSVLINKQGTLVGKYRKMRLPPSEVAAPYSMTEGTTPEVFDTEFGKIGMEICYDIDLRFPEVTKMYADLGAELILVPSWGDYTHSGMQFARQNNVFMVTAVRGVQWTDPYPNAAIIANDGSIINGFDVNSGIKSCYADINLTQKTWSVPEPTNYSGVTPPPIRTAIPFAGITASDSLPGRDVQTLDDGYIDNINAGPLKGLKGWSSDTKEPTVIFDMGSLKKIGSVGIVQFDAFYQEEYYKFYVSQDGVNYVEYTKGANYSNRYIKDYTTGSSVSVKCYKTPIGPGYKYIDFDPPLDIRYIKIVGYGNKILDTGNSSGSYKDTNLTEVTAFEPLDPSATSGPFPTMVPTPTPTKTPKPSVTPSPTPGPTPPYLFNDVPDDHWAKEQIYSLATKKIIAGYKNEDGSYSFRPGENIKRSEFIKILTVAFGVYNANSVYDGFTDVNKSSWYYSYVASAVNEGLTSGISTDKFGSDLDISRQDLATFIGRALTKYKGYVLPDAEHTSSAIDKFIDNSQIQDYAKPSVALLADNAVINGYNEGGSIYFKPFNNASRAEVAKIADKSLSLNALS